eukprot:8801708-Ditylum_brightwellii.AAC.1
MLLDLFVALLTPEGSTHPWVATASEGCTEDANRTSAWPAPPGYLALVPLHCGFLLDSTCCSLYTGVSTWCVNLGFASNWITWGSGHAKLGHSPSQGHVEPTHWAVNT